MEKMYHRKRSKETIQEKNTEMVYLKRQEQSNVGGAQTPPLSRQGLPTSDCTLQGNETREDHIEVGYFYEVDHTKLPPRVPAQLRSIRVVMVNEKTKLNVSVRYPSIPSLQRYYSNSTRETFPELDENFVMGTKLAEKVLYRQISSQEFSEKGYSEEFWPLICNSISGFGDFISKKAGTCFSELKCNGMLHWGSRRLAKFIGRHRESNPQSSSSFIRGEKEKDEGDDEEVEEEEEEEEDEEEVVTEGTYETKLRGKRKRDSSSLVEKAKNGKRGKRKQVIKAKNKCKQLVVFKNPKDRWSTERYMLAEKNLLLVMKAKGAVYGNPILRPELRAEARKRIGDTGLLDHLLKHMAGKVAPGGAERFRRRHNAEGAMEYWLESADLADIRKEAGVQDPYWTPPPGWKPGDCPSQDPVCARELKQLKEETSKIGRVIEEMVPKMQMEEELTKLRRDMEELLSRKQHEETQAIVVSDRSATGQKLDVDTSLVPLKSNLGSPLGILEKYEEQLMIISKYVKGIQEEIGKLKTKVEEGTKSGSALMVSTECSAEKEKKQGEEKSGAVIVQKQEVGAEEQRNTNYTKERETKRTAATVLVGGGGGGGAEQKAAKIRRLKSGFRICKPQGTFLWPNMVCSNSNSNMSSQVVVQVEDLLMVPTPPSVSSSTASAPPQLPYHSHSASPVKPLAERRAVTVTVHSVGQSNFSTTSHSTPINLNDPPESPGDGLCGTPSSSSQQTFITATTVKPHMGPWEVLRDGSSRKENEQQKQDQGGLPRGGGTWLALATPTPALEDSTRG